MPQQYSTLVLIALMVVAFYFLILRPQKKRQQAVAKTMRELEPGTKVLLGSGLFGTIVSIGDKQAVLEISPGVHLTVLKQAIVRVAGPADEDTVVGDDAIEDSSLDALDADYEARNATDTTPATEPTGYSAPEGYTSGTDAPDSERTDRR